MSSHQTRSRRSGRPNRSRPWASKSSNRCAICGKAGADRPWRWPEGIKLFAEFSHAHYKCLGAIQRVRTEWSSGSVHERWQTAPPLGSPRKILQQHRRRTMATSKNGDVRSKTKPQNAPSPSRPFCGTVRPHSMKRTGDSLVGKTRVKVPHPPKNALLPSCTKNEDNHGKIASEKRKEKHIHDNRKKKISERAAFLRILPPTKDSREMPLIIPENVGLRPKTPQLHVVQGTGNNKPLAIRVLLTEEPLIQPPPTSSKSPKWRF